MSRTATVRADPGGNALWSGSCVLPGPFSLSAGQEVGTQTGTVCHYQ